MTNTNGFSDSQESAILGEEEYNEIEKEMGGTLPLLTEHMDDEILDIPEDKYDISDLRDYDLPTFTHQGKRSNEGEEEYFSIPEPVAQHDDTFPGRLNFQYTFADGCAGQDWVYSSSLDKVFIKMEKTLPLRFTWDPSMEGLYLRTSMLFKLEQYRSDPVKRCHNHMALNNENIDPQRIKHVVHCVNHSSSIYEERNEHLSILTPLCTPEPGSQYVPMCFKFLCKNSCPSGMNRRPTELVFTLEDRRSVILGRRKLLVRVCSCPKRDKQKEEVELAPKKRKLSSGKKLLTPSCDTHVFKIELNVVGKENYLSVLKYAYDIMAGQAARTGQYEFFKPYMEDILRKTP